MSMLQHIAKHRPQMVLADFVEVVNDLLPQFLPSQGSGSRGQEPVNSRLVRHYTTQGLLDKPLRLGREARYIYRHLLQLLVLRRLLAEGYSASSISGLISGQPDEGLESILKGGVQLTVEAANPALAFLSQIRDREDSSRLRPILQQQNSAVGSARPAFQAPPINSASAASSQAWIRLTILDGLELHVRQDFVGPATTHEQDSLLQLIADQLTHLNSHPR